MREICLVLIKPDAVKRKLTGEILSRFERTGLQINVVKSVYPTPELVKRHYYAICVEDIKTSIVHYFCETKYEDGEAVPVIVALLSGFNAIQVCRKLLGATECSKALPGTIRGDYGTEDYESRKFSPKTNRAIRNLVHASDSPGAAMLEWKVWASA